MLCMLIQGMLLLYYCFITSYIFVNYQPFSFIRIIFQYSVLIDNVFSLCSSDRFTFVVVFLFRQMSASAQRKKGRDSKSRIPWVHQQCVLYDHDTHGQSQPKGTYHSILCGRFRPSKQVRLPGDWKQQIFWPFKHSTA